MGRRLIFFTPYLHSDTTRAAIRAAELSQQLGAKALMVNVARTQGRVDPYWDCRVLAHRSCVQYMHDDLLVFFAAPSLSWGAWLALHDLPYVVVHNNVFSNYCFGIYECASRVICTDKQSYMSLDQIPEGSQPELQHLPWDIGGSQFAALPSLSEPIFILPMHDMHWQAVYPRYIDVLSQYAEEYGFHLVLTESSRWPKPLKQHVQRLIHKHSRLSSVRMTTDVQLRELFATASLIVWPGTYDPFGTITQLGLYSGVPVLTWRVGMSPELIKHWQNGVLISAKSDKVSENHRCFITAALKLAIAPQQLYAMRDRTHDSLLCRQRAFVEGWQDIMELKR